MRFLPLLMMLAAAVFAAGAVAQAPHTPDPASIPADWHYDTPMAPLPRPEWVESMVFLEMYNNPVPDKVNLAPWARRMQEAGITICMLSDEGWIEPLHKHGIKTIRGMRPFVAEDWKEELIKSHPEWALSRDDGSAEKEAACLISPFGDALIELLARKLKETGYDGYQFDGWYQTGYCQCQGCRTLYKQEAGLEIPPKMDPRDPAFRKYLVWRDKKVLQRALQLRAAIKAVNPEAILVNWTNNDANGAYPSSMPETLNCVFDVTSKEWWDAADVFSIWLNKRMRGSSGDRPPVMEPYTFLRWLKDIDPGIGHGSSLPRAELYYRLNEGLAMGAIPWTWPGVRGAWDEKDWERFVDDVVAFAPLVHRGRTMKYAACLDSYSTLQMSNIELSKEFHNVLMKRIDAKVAGHRGGAARALLEEQIPFDVISEHNVTPEVLAQYKVLVLPNDFCMSERVAGVIREYVKQGGGLVATFESSLYDQWGEPRQDFALADLFGAHYESSRPEGASRLTVASREHPVTADPRLSELLNPTWPCTYYGKYAQVKIADGATTLLTAVEPPPSTAPADSPAAKQPTFNWTPLVCTTPGQGRVAYFPAGIDHAYFVAGYPYERLLLANAVRWAAGAEPPASVDAPLAVFAGFFTKESADGRESIVNLLNTLNTTMGHGYVTDKEFAIREEVVPVADIKVTFAGPRPTGVMLVPAGTALEPKQVEGGWQVTVPKLDLHAAVIARY